MIGFKAELSTSAGFHFTTLAHSFLVATLSLNVIQINFSTTLFVELSIATLFSDIILGVYLVGVFTYFSGCCRVKPVTNEIARYLK